jgi:hypothetical protein
VVAAIAAATGVIETTSVARIASRVGLAAIFIVGLWANVQFFRVGPRAEMHTEDERHRRQADRGGRTE